VAAFVQRHFTWPGTLHLHSAALGLDILRAPVNVVLSPILVLARIAAWICRKLRLARVSGWLLDRRLLLRTAVSARVEAAILHELLDVPLSTDKGTPDRASMSRAILAAPRFREMIRSRGTVAEAQATADRIIGAVGDYTVTRSSIAEFTTGLATLVIGAIVFQALTPGMIAMAPGVAQAVSYDNAIADFPLGAPLAGVWYGVFPVGPSPSLIAGSVVGLMFLGSVIAAFAGHLRRSASGATGRPSTQADPAAWGCAHGNGAESAGPQHQTHDRAGRDKRADGRNSGVKQAIV
jgi:hypothetical protein